jgi:outer membrane receptor for ferrienterochelin and colicin
MSLRFIFLFSIGTGLLLNSATAQKTQSTIADTTISFKVFGACEQCKERIEKAVKGKGVIAADWNVDSKMLQLTYQPSRVTLDKIHNRIIAVGHDTYLKKANIAVYNQLPSCCKYRELENTKAESIDSLTHQIDSTLNSANYVSAANQEMHHVRGIVLEVDNKGAFKPLMSATINWLGSNVAAFTDSNGVFIIQHGGSNDRLVISYAGFTSDTITVLPNQEVKIILGRGKQLKEVKVTATRSTTIVSASDPFRVSTMTKRELFKAACCNLSESFETNPSVDVSYNDAVTGSKQIQLLGLSGTYTQLTVENLPGPRGIATSQGLNSIPGTWIESIQLMKGTGSVANGFESIAGQINVELKKPQDAEKLFANVYANDQGKTDLNLNVAQPIGSKWSTALLLHDAFLVNKNIDYNKDGFRDLPIGNLFTAMNRWMYDDHKGWTSQLGLSILDDKKTGGQTNFDPAKKFADSVYGLQIDSKRAEAFGKLGYVFPGKKYQSIGLQLSAFTHEQRSYFGLNNYDADQKNLYSNLIYQSIIGSTANKFRTGLSFVLDHYNEDLNAVNYRRNESVVGGFFEYTFSPSEKFQLVTGIRADHNNLYGWFATPRLNLRYEPVKGTTIRVSSGRGQRTANIFAENMSVLASSRDIHILSSSTGKAYGLNPEVAWNSGIVVDQRFHLFTRSASFSVEFFRTDFSNQVVVDLEDPRMVDFYNLQGKSYSNSFQAEMNFEPIRKLTVRMAYRMFDVKTTYHQELLQKPYTARHRAFTNLAYEINGWKFDYTVNYNSSKRIPSTSMNPPAYQRAENSPGYFLMNAQISKTLGKKSNIDLYVGGENLTNYFQKDAIIAADQPFGPYFDASMIWGPVTGRMFYGGVRFTLASRGGD